MCVWWAMSQHESSSISGSSNNNNGNNHRGSKLSSNFNKNGSVSLVQYETSTSHHILNVEYIEELVDKYSLPVDLNNLEHLSLNQKFEEIRNYLKNEIYKQYKLQEGAEKMRNASTDKKRINNLNLMIKESNGKIEELNHELNDLNSYIVISQSESSLVLDPMNGIY